MDNENVTYHVELTSGTHMDVYANEIKSINIRQVGHPACIRIEFNNGGHIYAKNLKRLTKLVEREKSILFRGKEYPVYVVKMFAGTEREHYVRVSTTDLSDAIVADGSQGSTLDNEFTYYFKPEDLKKSDETIVYMILRNCYEEELYEAVFGKDYGEIDEGHKPEILGMKLFNGTRHESLYHVERISRVYRHADMGEDILLNNVILIDDEVYDRMSLMQLIDYVEKQVIERYCIVLD